ncbi:MAG: alpha/beta hydrolase-fold protein [Proteobacteria bacterium]|nr:alpha/beta hydrolase-fold protein [Pseudomonadota bacterium]MDA1300485.1 alpha/beta hydrolase-fold protein [Pseudomonadota bacterium]
MASVESTRGEGVPQGKVEHRSWNSSSIYPETRREYSVYVPARYDGIEPACLMVFQDGGGYLHDEGQVRAPVVMDNLIHSGEMPVTIGIFVNPGTRGEAESTRALEYVANGETYAKFLEQEIIAAVSREYRITDNPVGRCICGMSDGGLAAFAVAWERPDLFNKVICHIASFVRLIDGEGYPHKVRQSRRNPKPLRVFLQDGRNELDIEEGDWTLGNITMAAALQYGRYEHRFELGDGGHDLKHGGELFPDTLRWMWRDFPGVKGAGDAPDCSLVTGQWRVRSNGFGMISDDLLTLTETDGGLAATLHNDADGDLTVTGVRFNGEILSYDYVTPPSQKYWGKGNPELMTTWLRLSDDRLDGVMSCQFTEETSYDFKVNGLRVWE